MVEVAFGFNLGGCYHSGREKPSHLKFAYLSMDLNFSSSGFPGMPESFGIIWIAAMWVITAIIHIAFAIEVYLDVQPRNQGTFLVGRLIWALATLLGGVVTVGIYWAIHHSTLRPKESTAVDLSRYR
jgi:hypothetical protein